MLEAIKHGLGNILNFQGRDARQAFWFHVLFMYLIFLGISMAASIPLMIQTIMAGVEQGIAHAQKSGSPDGADAAVTMAMNNSMVDGLPLVIWAGFAGAVIFLAGVSASIVRRLHDSNLSGYWAVFPIGLKALSTALRPLQLGRVQQVIAARNDPGAMFDMFDSTAKIAALASWSAIAMVIFLGIRKSTPGPNRFGETPFTA